MKVAFLSPFVFRLARGNERVTQHLSRQLALLGHEVTVLAWAGPRQVLFDARVRVRRMPNLRYWESRWAIPFYAWQLVRQSFDVVNVFFAAYGEAEAIRMARMRRRFAVNFIAGFPLAQTPYQFEMFKQRWLAPCLDRVIVLSENMRVPIEQYLRRPTQVTSIGVDLDFFDPRSVDASEWRDRLQILPGEQVLLSVAALETRKGIEQVLAALPTLLGSGMAIRYVVAGDGPERARLEQRIEELGLRAHAHLLGVVDDVRPLYRLADVFVLLAKGEGLPNVMLEALAMALPIVVANEPPFDTFVQPEFGSTVNANDADAVAQILQTLLRDSTRRREMGSAGRGHVQAHCAWPFIARQYVDLFEAEMRKTSKSSLWPVAD